MSDEKPTKLADALREFAKKPDPVQSAVKDFAAQPTQSPPPKLTPAAAPAYGSTIPSVDPVAHMKVALSYIDEVTAGMSHVTSESSISLLAKLTTAAQHVSKARDSDPSAVVTAYTKDNQPYQQTQDDLSATILYIEGGIAGLTAANWTGPAYEGRKYLIQAKTAFEGALRYKPNDADFHYELAKVFKLLGDKENALAQAHEAIRCNPAHIASIKFIDASGGQWEPAIPDVRAPRGPIRYKTIFLGGAVLCFFVSGQLSGTAAGILAFSGVGLLALTGLKWYFDGGDLLDTDYRKHAQARLDREVAQTKKAIYDDRYDRESEERRKKRQR